MLWIGTEAICRNAGHSLGGALAMLIAAMARLQLRHPPHQLACQTFGSPPVLAHRIAGSAGVLQVTSAARQGEQA